VIGIRRSIFPRFLCYGQPRKARAHQAGEVEVLVAPVATSGIMAARAQTQRKVCGRSHQFDQHAQLERRGVTASHVRQPSDHQPAGTGSLWQPLRPQIVSSDLRSGATGSKSA
jgi:hypothetical protein